MAIAPVVWRKPSQASEFGKAARQPAAVERASVEHVFARQAQHGGKCVRCIGLERANVVIGLKGAIHTLMRLARLKQHAIRPVSVVRVLQRANAPIKIPTFAVDLRMSTNDLT